MFGNQRHLYFHLSSSECGRRTAWSPLVCTPWFAPPQFAPPQFASPQSHRFAPRGVHPHRSSRVSSHAERDLFIDNLLVRIHFIIVMIWWTGLAPWGSEFVFPGSLTSTFLATLFPHTVFHLVIGSGLRGVPREQKMLEGHLPRVIYHQVY